jgi:hypothetical protein
VHLFRPSLSFLAKAQPRFEIRRGQKDFLQKTSLEKVLTIFFYSICYQLANKTRNLLHICIQLLIYIIYGDWIILGFVGFVVNLLNRSTDGATLSVRKRVTFRPLVSK